MNMLINVSFAWLAVAMMIMLSVVYIFRVANQKFYQNKHPLIKKLNKGLRKPHKTLGFLAIGFGLIHGLYSSIEVLSPNKGTILWIVLILLGLSFYARKVFTKKYPWIKLHRILTVASIVLLLFHLIEVGGFVGIDGLEMALRRDGYFAEDSLTVVEDVKETHLKTVEEKTEDDKGGESVKETENSSVVDEELKEDKNNETTEIEEVVAKVEVAKAEEVIVKEETVKAEEIILSKYIDGTYYGVADGFGPNLKVEVIIVNDLIVSVRVVEHNEHKERYWGKPVREIPMAIVEAQNTDIDSISGATYTSQGIKNAVDYALREALRK